ncbi:unnamed protein product [Mytilus edulis]|uniref:Uncharacterized protein n=1 Tax=Mytilus edulis TaxID=6550 RepID=A0A8S3RAH3_MYTED|nr:unnamed protein product [Mytilus edulis]
MNNQSQIPSVSIVKDSFLTQAEPGESVNHFNHSFRGKALRRSIKAIPGKKTGKWKEKTSVTKRLESGISSINMVAFYAYMNTGEEHPGQHQILVFDVIKTNVGLAYNKHNDPFGRIFTNSDEINDIHCRTEPRRRGVYTYLSYRWNKRTYF